MIKKNQVKVVVFVLIITIAIFALIYDLYTHAFARAALLVMMLLPIIIKRKQLLGKWFDETPV